MTALLITVDAMFFWRGGANILNCLRSAGVMLINLTVMYTYRMIAIFIGMYVSSLKSENGPHGDDWSCDSVRFAIFILSTGDLCYTVSAALPNRGGAGNCVVKLRAV